VLDGSRPNHLILAIALFGLITAVVSVNPGLRPIFLLREFDQNGTGVKALPFDEPQDLPTISLDGRKDWDLCMTGLTIRLSRRPEIAGHESDWLVLRIVNVALLEYGSSGNALSSMSL
jgi:hypothetical protein